MKILIVDDTFTNRLFISELLKRNNHDCKLAENGKVAIEYLLKEPFDMVIMDIEMPVMNGLDATNHIREKLDPPLNRIPIFAITSHHPESMPEMFHDVDFNGIISKPISIEKLEQMFKEII